MLGYRAHFEVVDRGAVVDDSLREFRTWLRSKGYNPESLGDDGGVTEIAPSVEASLFKMSGDDSSESWRAHVSERRPEGTWASELTIHLPADQREPAEVLLDIHNPSASGSQPILTGVPRLARNLLGALQARDSSARLSDQPVIVRGHHVDSIAAVIADPNRRGITFVAGSADSLPLVAWSEYVATLLRQTVGLVSAYVLDASATQELESLLGPTHAVAAGTLRTYLPSVETGSDLDARRHRIFYNEDRQRSQPMDCGNPWSQGARDGAGSRAARPPSAGSGPDRGEGRRPSVGPLGCGRRLGQPRPVAGCRRRTRKRKRRRGFGLDS